MASAQIPKMSFVVCAIAVLDWRFASATTLPRAELATEFAPLNHMLMNGFFFSQGFDTDFLVDGRAAALDRLSQKR